MLLDKPYYDYDYEVKEVVKVQKQLTIDEINRMNRNGDFEREMAEFGLGSFVVTKPIPSMTDDQLQEYVKQEEIKKHNNPI